MKEKVSIIIPAYNVENYIDRCLRSACNQTYTNLQIVVVDDGSSDNTLKIIKEFSSIDDRIIVLHKGNCGVSSARNMGLAIAEGEYITFLDSDDELESNAIEVLVSKIEETNADLVSYQFSRWNEDGTRSVVPDFISGTFILNDEQDCFDFIIKELLPYHIPVEIVKMYRRDIIIDNHIFFPESCSIGEDFSFTIKYILNSKKIECIPDKLYRYSIRNNSAMGGSRSFCTELTERIEMLFDIWNYAQKAHFSILCNKFAVFFALALNNIYIDHSADEAVENLRMQDKIRFVTESYKNLAAQSEEFFRLDNSEIKKIKYRYHMYIRSSLIGSTGIEKFILSLYDSYREIKGKERLEKWKMPY